MAPTLPLATNSHCLPITVRVNPPALLTVKKAVGAAVHLLDFVPILTCKSQFNLGSNVPLLV